MTPAGTSRGGASAASTRSTTARSTTDGAASARGAAAARADAITDGRRRKGAQRRQLLIDATLRVIELGGVSAVTQREVAKQAELPPSAIMYYFPTIDDLLRAALTACNDDCLRMLADIDQATAGDDDAALARLSQFIADGAGTGRAHVAAEYELYLQAARRPEFRAEVNRWTAAVDQFLTRFIADPARRCGVAAAVDGLLLRCYCDADPPSAAQIRDILRHLLDPGHSR